MKILVTGAEGFIGSHLCPDLEEAGHDVFASDLSHGDLCDPRTSLELLSAKPDLCVHLAAHVGRERGEDNGFWTVQENAAMTTNIARACAQYAVRLCYVSTSEVYGPGGEYYWREEDLGLAEPINLYGLTKRWGEEVCRLYAPDGLTILRLSMPYGPNLPPGDGRAAIINFLNCALNRVVLTVHRDAERSWSYVGDTVRAMRMVIESDIGGAWNIGRDDNAMLMRDLADLTVRVADVPKNYRMIREVDPPDWGQIVVKRLSMEKLRGLGFRPQVGLEDGMRRTLAWLKQRERVAA